MALRDHLEQRVTQPFSTAHSEELRPLLAAAGAFYISDSNGGGMESQGCAGGPVRLALCHLEGRALGEATRDRSVLIEVTTNSLGHTAGKSPEPPAPLCPC